MTAQEAVDALCGLFRDALEPLGVVMVYDDIPGSRPTDDSTAWARVTVRHAEGRQSSLAGETGARRWTRDGIATAQLFTPAGDGLQRGRGLAETAVHALQDARIGGLLLHRQAMREAGASGAYTQINVSTLFSYDQVR